MEIPSGQMASLNCVSKKTLRVYRDHGLLEPARVDDENGYGFYTYGQCAVIDMIQQLQSLGVTLAEMKALIDDHDIASLVELLQHHKQLLAEERFRLELAEHNVDSMLRNCDLMRHEIVFDTIVLEHIGPRRALRFPIFNEDAEVLSNDVAAFLEQWELNLRLTKRHMIDEGLPLELFHRVGCSVAADDLRARRLRLNASVIFISDEQIADRFDAAVVPEGDFLSLYKPSYSSEEGNTEVSGLGALLDYIEGNGWSIAGDYIGEVIAETPAFQFEGREMLYKLQIPVDRGLL